MSARKVLCIAILEDDKLGGELLRGFLAERGHKVHLCRSAATMLQIVSRQQPDVAIVDLDLGAGPSGMEVVSVISRRYPDVRVAILTAFRTPRLVGERDPLPPDVKYLVKADVSAEAIVEQIENLSSSPPPTLARTTYELTQDQADVLRMMARGLSNTAIARRRGTTVRAVRLLVGRIYSALDIPADSNVDQRQLAIRRYRGSDITVVTL